jgi:hypothetical protein
MATSQIRMVPMKSTLHKHDDCGSQEWHALIAVIGLLAFALAAGSVFAADVAVAVRWLEAGLLELTWRGFVSGVSTLIGVSLAVAFLAFVWKHR